MKTIRDVVIYEINMWGSGGYGEPRWHGVHDFIWTALDKHSEIALMSKDEPDRKDTFHSSGVCWQNTGHHGVYSEEAALLMLPILRECFPDRRFQIVKTHYFIAQEEVATIGPKELTRA